MPVARRALLIGLFGPVIQAVGFAWLGAHLLISHLHDPFDPRHLFFEGGTLMIGAGLLVSIICIPVAIEVARSTEDDVALKVFGKGRGFDPHPSPLSFESLRTGSAKEKEEVLPSDEAAGVVE